MYIAGLFSILNNDKNFCFKETKTGESIICGKKFEEKDLVQKVFFYINNNIKGKNLFNIFLDKYKEKYSCYIMQKKGKRRCFIYKIYI